MTGKLSKKEKLKKPEEFKKAARKGKKYSTEFLSLSVIKVSPSEKPSASATPVARLGITIPNRVEKSAVKRNKARRLVREFFRLNKVKFKKGFDYSFYIRKNIFTEYGETEKEIEKLLKKAGG